MAYSDNYINQYFYSVCGASEQLLGGTKKSELTKEEKLKRVENYIERYDVEHDEKYIYLYKAVNLDGTNIHQSGNKIIFEVGKTFTEKCDQDINTSCSNGLHAGTFDIAVEFGKGNGVYGKLVFPTTSSHFHNVGGIVPTISWFDKSSKSKPVNPQNLFKEVNFRLLKVKIYKEHVVVPNNTDGKIRCNQMEIIEEIKINDKLTYTLIGLVESENGYKLTYDVVSDMNNQRLKVEIVNNSLDITQDEINSKISSRIEQMQKIYDKFEELRDK